MVEDNVFIGIGSNLGDREESLRRAREWVGDHDELTLQDTSSVIETDPHDVDTDKPFLNQVARTSVSSHMTPPSLLKQLMAAEQDIGRDRSRAPDRVIDLDLLYWADRVRDQDPVVPHPEIHRREFVLRSMVELAPLFTHPTLNQTQRELLRTLRKDSQTG